MPFRSRTAATWSLLLTTTAIVAGCIASGAGESASPSSGRPSSAPPSPSTAPSPSASPSPTTPPSPSPVPTPSSPPSPSPSTGIAYPTGANDLVLRMTNGGGFVPIGFDLTGLPGVSVYGDGRVMSPGPQIMIYPGPLLPNIQVEKLTPVAMQRLLAAAAAAGLTGADGRFDATGIADAPTAMFVVNAEGRRHVVSAYALFETDSTAGMDQATIEARAKLRAFVDQVGNLAKLVGAAEISDGGTYQATAMRLIVTPQPDQPVGASPSPPPSDLVQLAIAWPLPQPLATFGAPVGPDDPGAPRCGVIDGPDLDLLRPLLEKANVLTPWTSGVATFSIRARPLLPDESGCTREAT